jgi:hypothetical protein
VKIQKISLTRFVKAGRYTLQALILVRIGVSGTRVLTADLDGQLFPCLKSNYETSQILAGRPDA